MDYKGVYLSVFSFLIQTHRERVERAEAAEEEEEEQGDN